MIINQRTLYARPLKNVALGSKQINRLGIQALGKEEDGKMTGTITGDQTGGEDMIYFVTSNKGKFAEASNIIKDLLAKEHRIHRDSGRYA